MKYVIIGAGAAGINAAKNIRKIDKTGEICIISQDEKIFSRCMLHHVIAGEKTMEDICFVPKDFFTANNIKWLKGINVTDILFDKKKVILENNNELEYDSLLIASGAKSAFPPIKGLKNAKGVFGLRDSQDVDNIINGIKDVKSALIIGGGLIGLDAATALLARGIKVTLVEMSDRLLPLQLDAYAANAYQVLFEKAGAEIYTGVSVNEISNGNQGARYSAVLSSELSISCDMIIAATGIIPNIAFIKEDSLEKSRGITVNSKMQTSIKDVYAAGDVTGISAIWPAAVKQGIIAGYNMAGVTREAADYFNAKNTINLMGLTTASLGLVQAPDDSYHVETFLNNGAYRKVIHKEGRVHGIIMQRNISHCGIWQSLIKDKIKIQAEDAQGLENISYADFFKIDQSGNFSINQA